ncbi:hypothetical protein DPMN_100918 [Dreissena polymorpha]|uniref:Uncharacterized protein n=1 Tax=Dreissena polymorpha TaxID=45954 RepID=A0A9D4LK46_DREPO|nr:hypothetical protein DPMN_100918 [Dreissena polymorpha]
MWDVAPKNWDSNELDSDCWKLYCACWWGTCNGVSGRIFASFWCCSVWLRGCVDKNVAVLVTECYLP